MKNVPIKTKILSVHILPNADPHLLRFLKADVNHRSLGFITTDSDDVDRKSVV